LGRLISGVALALMMALAAQPALAQGGVRARRQARAQAMRERAEARRANRAAGAEGKGNKPRDGAAGGNAVQAPHPPNEGLFKPNPNVVHPNGPANAWRPANVPPAMEERLRDMSPQEQERFLQNNQRFQSLPPQRQAEIRQRLQAWNRLSPERKDQMIHNWQVLRNMTPDQRQLYQSQILPKWEQMSPERRQLVLGRQHTLQAMTPAQRQAALNDPRFMQGLTPDEQGVLRNLNTLRNPNP